MAEHVVANRLLRRRSYRRYCDAGPGHAMAFVHVLMDGATISDKHGGSSGSHRDASAILRLDGKTQRTAS